MNGKIEHRLCWLILIALLILPAGTQAQRDTCVFDVPLCGQEMSQWCWAGCSQSILGHHGFFLTQTEIAEYGTEGANIWNWLWGESTNPTRRGIDMILAHFGNIGSTPYSTALSVAQITTEMCTLHPYVIRWGWSSGGGHFLVGHGIDDSDYVYYMDPLPVGVGGFHIASYDWVVQGGSHTWTATLTTQGNPAQVIVIDPNPDELNAPWELLCPDLTVLTGSGDTTLPEMDVGDYTITWGEVGQWGVPEPETLNLTETGMIIFSCDYASPFMLEMVLTGPATQIGGADEVVTFSGEITNLGAADDSCTVDVGGLSPGWSCVYTTPAGTYSGPSILPIASGATAPITIDIDSEGNAGCATMTATAVSIGDPLLTVGIEFQKINDADVLLVDDDGGELREVSVGEALAASGVVWGLWDLTWGELEADDLQVAAAAVVWVAGDAIPSLTTMDRDALGTFMDGGGDVLLTGQEIGFDLADPASPNFSPETIVWFVTYAHANYVTTYSTSLAMTGVAGDPIGDGLAFTLQAGNQTTPDVISAGYGADAMLTYDSTPSWVGGITWTDGATHLVYLAFGLEGIHEAAERNELMARTLVWFEIGASGVPTPSGAAPRLGLAQNSPNPFRPATAIRYELHAPGPVSLRIYDVAGRLVRTLVDAHRNVGTHAVSWDGRTDAGRAVAGGVYFYRLETSAATRTRRMVLAP